MPSHAKGLDLFILDIRNCKDLEEEQRRINAETLTILQLSSSVLSSRHVNRLVYIYLLGYLNALTAGISRATMLLGSSSFEDKCVGYFALSHLIAYDNSVHANWRDYIADLANMMIPHLLADLRSSNDAINSLALQFIASKFTIDDESISHSQAQSFSDPHDFQELVDTVYSFSTSLLKPSSIRSKASIALFALIKLDSSVISLQGSWIPRALQLLSNSDLGIVISSIPLIQFLVETAPAYATSTLPQAASLLGDLVLEDKCPQEYMYYDVPAPWLIVRLFSLVENLLRIKSDDAGESIAKLDTATLAKLRQVVARLIRNAMQPHTGSSSKNTRHSILFLAVSLAVFLDASPEAITGAIDALIGLLQLQDTNTRYLALDAMIKLCAYHAQESNSPIAYTQFAQHLPVVHNLLYDKDVSVKRKALDLLYTNCNPLNYRQIIDSILGFYPTAELSLKTEAAVKIAVLSENYAQDSTWYVTTMLKLLLTGGEISANCQRFMSHEVWERIVQIVVNNEDLQGKTSKLLVNHMRNPAKSSATSEYLVKVAASVLGEFGHLVPASADYNINIQFELLYEQYFQVSLSTRAMLLSCFLKFSINAPDSEFVPDILDLYEAETVSLDLEIQTRAHEYLRLATQSPGHAFAKRVVLRQPPFTNQKNALLDRLGSVGRLSTLNRSRSVVGPSHLNQGSRAQAHTEAGNSGTLDQAPPATFLSSNWYKGYHRMHQFDAGIFFDNLLVKITYRVSFENNQLRYRFVIINNTLRTTGTTITGLKVLELHSGAHNQSSPSYTMTLTQSPDLLFSEKTSMEIDVKMHRVVENDESPIMSLVFNCGGSFSRLNLKFPVRMLRTLAGTGLISVQDFNLRWSQIGEQLPGEGLFATRINTPKPQTTSNILRLYTRLRFTVIHAADDSQDIHAANTPVIMAAGILHTNAANYGVLTTLTSNSNDGMDFTVQVRCTGGGIAQLVALTLKEIFDGKPS